MFKLGMLGEGVCVCSIHFGPITLCLAILTNKYHFFPRVLAQEYPYCLCGLNYVTLINFLRACLHGGPGRKKFPCRLMWPHNRPGWEGWKFLCTMATALVVIAGRELIDNQRCCHGTRTYLPNDNTWLPAWLPTILLCLDLTILSGAFQSALLNLLHK